VVAVANCASIVLTKDLNFSGESPFDGKNAVTVATSVSGIS
jgi:hypothetical protein